MNTFTDPEFYHELLGLQSFLFELGQGGTLSLSRGIHGRLNRGGSYMYSFWGAFAHDEWVICHIIRTERLRDIAQGMIEPGSRYPARIDLVLARARVTALIGWCSRYRRLSTLLARLPR